MILKRLEINGFKSFAGKTSFQFSSGIVGIVGPNGSGKSNVIDAIRWILGERETKNLRGDKIEDLIFAGTPKKPRSSMAQVTLVFDNIDGELPFDFKEVTVSRRVARNGDSEYSINDSEVRLKDIIDFFSKIKLGSKGLTIISQGAGDIFVKSSVSERMSMVQEILGLREFQIKKLEAQRKLKNTSINLEKVRAMMEEVAPRLRTLKKQTARWEKRFEIEQELKDIEDKFYSFKIKQLNLLYRQAKEPLVGIDQEIKEQEKSLGKIENELKQTESNSADHEKIELIQKSKRDLFNKKTETERLFFKLEAEIESFSKITKVQGVSFDELKKNILEVKSHLAKGLSHSSLEEVKNLIQEVIRIIDRTFDSEKENKKEIPEDLLGKKSKLESELKKIEEEILKIEREEKEISLGYEEFSKKFRMLFAEKEKTKEAINDLLNQKNKIKFEEEKINYKLEELKHQISSWNGSFAHYEKLATSPSFDVILNDEETNILEKRIVRLRGEISSIGEIDESLVKEAKEVEVHYDFLGKESKDLSEAIGNLRTLIKELNAKISSNFKAMFKDVNEEFNRFFRLMFGGGSAKMKVVAKEIPIIPSVEGLTEQPEQVEQEEEDDSDKSLYGIDIDVSIPQKKITSLEVLSGGERSLVSLAVLFALISVSPPPFLVLDEADSALDEKNSKRFGELIKSFSSNTQFIIVTHNRVTMESADVLYGVTMDDSGASKILSLKLE